MIITNKFVVINNPKTGSTFLRHCIKLIYERRRNTSCFLKRAINFKKYSIIEHYTPHPILKYLEQHGCVDEIPKRHKTKQIISVIRMPLSKITSEYHFGWWKENSRLMEDVLRKHLPMFPNLSPKDFVIYNELLNQELLKFYNIPQNIIIGNQSIEFIRLFFKNHKYVLKNKLSNEYFITGEFINDMSQVYFLKQHELQKGLISFLKTQGFAPDELELISKIPKQNISTVTKKYDKKELNEIFEKYVHEKEWVLFLILNKLGLIEGGY